MSDRSYNICKRCKNKFPTRKKINGKISRFYARLYCFKCVPFNGHINQYRDKDPSFRICKLCEKKFTSLAIIDGKKVELYLRQHCLKCVPFGENVNKHLSHEGERITCDICVKVYIYKRGTTNDSTTRCSNCRRIKSNKRMQYRCVQYKGGNCVICGFDKFIEALVFHHKNPKEKNFGIAQMRKRLGWEKIKKELNKCILLCANCHAGVHAGHINLGK